MEPNDLDKIFRTQIEQDSTELSSDELQSKEGIWSVLDINQNDQESVQRVGAKKWWLLAATLLFLILGAGLINMYNKLQTQTSKYNNIEQDYGKVVQEFKSVKAQLNQLDQKLNAQMQEQRNKKTESIVAAPTAKPQFIEKIIYVKDTIFSIQRIEEVASVEHIRDTIYIIQQGDEVEESSKIIAINLDQEDVESQGMSKNMTQPKKVEFVIGKKTLDKPSADKFKLQINGSNLARKNQ